MKRFSIFPRIAAGAASMAMFFAMPSAFSQEKTAELPVTRVVLFSSGVGFFEHNGTIEGNATARFPFKTEQINDVLKSMVLRDADGGSVNAVTYASQDPLTRALRSFAVDLSASPGMSELLAQIRGAEVTVMAPQPLTGKILGVEAFQRQVSASGSSVLLTEKTLNLVTAEGLRAVPLSSVISLKLTDARLNEEIGKALNLLHSASDTSRKAVDVQFSGLGKRRIGVGYVTETPVWKTSYRLDLTTEKPFVQGWAIVENTSDADWSNVNLSLVSGRPISFVQDLYTPLYIKRPEIRPQLQAQVGPQLYSAGIPQSPSASMGAGAMAAPVPAREYERSVMADGQMEESDEIYYQESTNLRGSGVTTAASGEVSGELFRFTVKAPVSLARRQSAMLPLVNGEIKAEKVSIYNAQTLTSHPLNGAWVTNSTGLRLLGGPVTVFDDGMYAGDALFDNFSENDKRLISYGVDLNCPVTALPDHSQAITKISIARGLLVISRMNSYSQTYRINNKSDKPKTLIIEHPLNTSRTLVEPKTFEEKTATLIRFRVSVPKSSVQDLVVKEQQPVSESLTLISAKSPAFVSYASSGQASKSVKEALVKTADLKAVLEGQQARLGELGKQKSEIENGQGRLRSNIETVGRDTPQGQRYLQKLLDDEDRIENLVKKIDETKAAIEKAQKDLEDFVKNLSLE